MPGSRNNSDFGLDRRKLLKLTGAGVLGSGTIPIGGEANQNNEEATGTTVYVGSNEQKLYALDAATGEIEWELTEPEDMIWSSPTVVDGTVYVGTGQNEGWTNPSPNDPALYAVDAATGDIEWEFNEPSNWITSSPTVVDETVYFGTWDKTIYALDAATGNPEWNFNEPKEIIYSAPAVANGTVYVLSWETGSFSPSRSILHALDVETGDIKWESTEFEEAARTSPTVVNETVYISVGETLYALNATTGNREWEFTDETPLTWASPTVSEGIVYIGSHDPKLYAVDAATGTLEWELTEAGGGFRASPTVSEGTVYISSRSDAFDDDAAKVFAVDAATGDIEWVVSEPPSMTSSPTVHDGTVYVGSGTIGDGGVYALNAATGDLEWQSTEVDGIQSSPTVVEKPSDGSSVDSRVRLGTLGHHHERIDEPVGDDDSPEDDEEDPEDDNDENNLERLNPDSEITVQPDTQVIFEIAADDKIQYVEWMVDGRSIGNSMGPWQGWDYGYGDAYHIRHTFESEGSYEVTAKAETDSEDQISTIWEVEVISDGNAAPSIETKNPDGEESLDPNRDNPLELEVTDPDEELDRVVWWLGHADVVLNVADIDGAKATTKLPADEISECIECPIIAWICDENGAMIQDSLWTIGTDTDTKEGELEVTISDVNTPVEAGEYLEVTAEIENTGSTEKSQEVELIVGHNPEVVEKESITLEGGESTEVSMGYDTPTVDNDQEFPIRVETKDNETEQNVTVFGGDESNTDTSSEFSVGISGTNTPINAGEYLEVQAEIQNTGNTEGTQEITLIVGHDPEQVDSQSVTLGSEETETLSLGYETPSVDNNQEFPVTIESEDSRTSETVLVYGTG